MSTIYTVYNTLVFLLLTSTCLSLNSMSTNNTYCCPENKKHLDVEVIDNSEDTVALNNYRELNYRYNRKFPSLKIEIRDKVTGKPLLADLIIQGIGNIEGVYHISDVIFDNKRNGRLSISCKKKGYFYIDSVDIDVRNSSNRVIRIELDPVASGKHFVLDGIEFVPGTSNLLEKSKPKLIRVVDFLNQNPSVKLEIQGHVYEPGSRASTAGQKTSLERATKVMNFLIKNGIDPERLTAVGLGNSKPLFINPRNPAEEQANRRVEFVVK